MYFSVNAIHVKFDYVVAPCTSLVGGVNMTVHVAGGEAAAVCQLIVSLQLYCLFVRRLFDH